MGRGTRPVSVTICPDLREHTRQRHLNQTQPNLACLTATAQGRLAGLKLEAHQLNWARVPNHTGIPANRTLKH